MRTFSVIGVCALLAAALPTSAQTFLQGTVYNPFGIPVQDATVTYGIESATTDADGVFYLGTPIVGSRRPLMQALPKQMRKSITMNGWRIAISDAHDCGIQVQLFDAMGRTVFSASRGKEASDLFVIDIQHMKQVPAGMYIMRAQAGNRTHLAKAMVTGPSTVAWQSTQVSEAAKASESLSKTLAGTLSIAATGLAQRDFSISQDVAIGLEFTLYYPGQNVPTAVDAIDTSETHNLTISNTTDALTTNNELKWAGNSRLRCYEVLRSTGGFSSQNVTCPMVRLNNGKIRVMASPAMGSRVVYVTDKTSTARDLFARPNTFADSWNQLLKGGQFSNIGGIKPSFPYAENSTGVLGENFAFSFKSGYYTESQPDGRMNIQMNMRFDYNQREEDCMFLGKFGDRPLLTKVTLEPGKSYITLTQIAENPHPLRRNDRIWNDAVLPFRPDQYIYPTKYAVSHCATQYKDMQSLGSLTQSTMDGALPYASCFGLYPEYGFAGTYYTSADACHLRVCDPTKAPGAKFYAHYDVPELWSSTNSLFEAPHDFVRAWEPKELKTRWYMTRGIGVVEFANDYIAISMPTSTTFKLMSPCPGIVSVYNYGQSTAIITDRRVGPDTVLAGAFTGGLRVMSKDGDTLCNVRLPLAFAAGLNPAYTDLQHMANLYGCDGSIAPTNLDTRFQTHYELEDATTRQSYMSCLASLLAINNVSSTNSSDALLSMGRAAYRSGGFETTHRYLNLVNTGSSADYLQQANFLRALMKMERDSSADFSNTPPEGAYFRALQKIASGDKAGAISELDALLSSRPNAVRPRILRTYLKSDMMDASIVYRTSPASLELWVALKELGYPGAGTRLTALLQQDAMATTRANDFLSEIKTGHWRAERRYEYDNAWFERVSLPAFPTDLKY